MFLLLLVLDIQVTGQYNFTASRTTGCTPMRVKYQFTSTATVDTITSYYWDFGNGLTSTLQSPDTVTYDAAGTFTPALVFNNRADLMIVKPDLITVHHTVPANFIYYDSVSNSTYVFAHSETLDTGVTYTYLWDFEGIGTRSSRKEIITFPAMDTFLVTLTVTDNLGCTSTTEQSVLVLEEISVQNVFTPNGDNFNDFFIITSNGGFPLRMKIFTRAGILIYETEGTTLTWDGYTASGQKLISGIYFYTIEAISGDPNKRYSKAGVLYLYR
jgi:gliding motility-associated-like protein